MKGGKLFLEFPVFIAFTFNWLARSIYKKLIERFVHIW